MLYVNCKCLFLIYDDDNDIYVRYVLVKKYDRLFSHLSDLLKSEHGLIYGNYMSIL